VNSRFGGLEAAMPRGAKAPRARGDAGGGVRPGRYGQGVEMSDGEVDFSLLVRREFSTRFFAKGNTIFREGEQGDEFFVVVGGEVEIRSGNRWFETVGQNGIFGEMALLDESPRSATAVALTDVTVAPIQEQQFLFMVKHTPFFALRVMRVLANRLRRQNKAA
jgi:CRP-like cAMP-binding protein